MLMMMMMMSQCRAVLLHVSRAGRAMAARLQHIVRQWSTVRSIAGACCHGNDSD